MPQFVIRKGDYFGRVRLLESWWQLKVDRPAV